MRDLKLPESGSAIIVYGIFKICVGKSDNNSYLEPTSFKHSDISWYPVPKFYKDDISHHKSFCIDIVFLSITEDSGFLQKKNPGSNCHLELTDQSGNWFQVQVKKMQIREAENDLQVWWILQNKYR